MKKRSSYVTAKVSTEEHATIREFAASFNEPMADVMRQLLLWAIENAPVATKTVRVLNLNGKNEMYIDGSRKLRGRKPKKV